MRALGSHVHICGIAMRGAVLSETRWKDFLLAVARAIKMNPIAKPASWEFPIDGHGGTGFTIVQPITESFLAVDTWSEHGGAYLHIVSCKPIAAEPVYGVLALFDQCASSEIENMLSL